MTYLSIIEKFKILFNTLLDFKFILGFTILLLILTFLYLIKKINVRKYIVVLMLSFTVIFGISIVTNYKVLSNTFDNFATIFFGNIYFPSIYVYVAVLVISFISFIVSIFNVMLKKVYKVINGIMFIVNNILFVIILNIIAKNKIDIFSVNSLYTNTSLVAILELSMELFILWILSLIAVYATNLICEKLSSKKTVKNEAKEEIFNPVLEVTNDLVSDVNVLSDLDELVSSPLVDVEVISNEQTALVIEEIQDIQEENVVIEEIQDIQEENVVIEEIEDVQEENVVIEEIQDIQEENVVIEEIQDVQEENVVIEEIEDVQEEKLVIEEIVNEEKCGITFNDILNGSIPVTYYDNSNDNVEFTLINPQMFYEDNYNKVKNENIIFNNTENVLDNIEFSDVDSTIIDNNINNIQKEVQLSVEEKTLLEKEKISEERLILNTISLNDLIDEEDNINEVKVEVDNSVDVLEVTNNNEENITYTVDDYKKIIKMLNELKNHSGSSNINIDDAIAISLISNYSIDDCIKFKNILENNLN